MDHFGVLHGFTWFYLALIDLSMVVHAKKPMFCKFCLWEPKVGKSIHVGITINPDIEIATAQRDCFSCHPVKRCNHINPSIILNIICLHYITPLNHILLDLWHFSCPTSTFIDDCFLREKDTSVGAVCCRLWTCAFESAPKMAGDIAACNIKVQDLYRRICCKICHALWSTLWELSWFMRFSILCTRKHHLWKYKLTGCIKATKNHFKMMFTTARMLASVWHQSGIFKLVHWWCTLCIVYRALQVRGSSDCLFDCTPFSDWVWHVTDKSIQRRSQNISSKRFTQELWRKKRYTEVSESNFGLDPHHFAPTLLAESLVFPRESSCPTKGRGWNILSLRNHITCICIGFLDGASNFHFSISSFWLWLSPMRWMNALQCGWLRCGVTTKQDSHTSASVAECSRHMEKGPAGCTTRKEGKEWQGQCKTMKILKLMRCSELILFWIWR